MGIDQFTRNHGSKERGGTGIINTPNQAVKAVKEAYDYLDYVPNADDFDEIKNDIGYTTHTSSFKRLSGITFSEAKNRAGLRGHSSSIAYSPEMGEDSFELGYISGVIIGDGHLTTDNTSRLSLSAIDKEFVSAFGKAICEWGNVLWDGFHSDNTEVSCRGPITRDGDGNSDIWTCSKTVLNVSHILIEYQDGTWDIEEILCSNIRFKRGMLRGLWDSEGSITKRTGRVRFYTTQLDIALLYMYLVDDLVGVHLEVNNDTVHIDMSHNNRLGEFSLYHNSSGYNTTVMAIDIPNRYINDFFSIVNPTIERKRDIFYNHIDSQ
jgi:hypothetical protein